MNEKHNSKPGCWNRFRFQCLLQFHRMLELLLRMLHFLRNMKVSLINFDLQVNSDF